MQILLKKYFYSKVRNRMIKHLFKSSSGLILVTDKQILSPHKWLYLYDDAQCAETNVKSIFLIFIFLVMVDFVHIFQVLITDQNCKKKCLKNCAKF